MQTKLLLCLAAVLLALSACTLTDGTVESQIQPDDEEIVLKVPTNTLGAPYIKSSNTTFSKGDAFSVNLGVNLGTYKLGAYTFDITYDSTYLEVNTGKGTNGVKAIKAELASPGNFSVNSSQAGTVKISGYILKGVSGSSTGACSLFSIFFKAKKKAGNTTITPKATILVSTDIENIGYVAGKPPAGVGITIKVE